MPSQADWLNDLSLMPPVSVTMQPRNLPVVEPLAALDTAELTALDAPAELAAELELLALDELLPHAAISSVAAPAATVAINEVCLKLSPLDQLADAQA
jgi:hypothetical protein